MGLIKTAVKTAVAVRTAHFVHDRIERRKQAEWIAQGNTPESFPSTLAGVVPAAPPSGTADSGSDLLAQLRELGDLKATGVLTEQEFEAQKRRILGGPQASQ